MTNPYCFKRFLPYPYSFFFALTSLTLFLLLSCSTILPTAFAQNQPVRTSSKPEWPNHFIVVIRDTETMKTATRIRGDIATFLPPLLYRGNEFANEKGIKLQHILPEYNPGRDRLSVVFAAIHSAGGPIGNQKTGEMCKAEHKFSAQAKNFFYWQPVKEGMNETEFMEKLGRWMNFTCRGAGSHYATALAEWMVLPYVHDQIQKYSLKSGETLYANTYLMILDNEVSYGSVAPDRELASLGTQEARGVEIQDKNSAEKIIHRVADAFQLFSPPQQDWMFSVAGYKSGTGRLVHGLKTKYKNRLRIRFLEIRLKEKNVQYLLDYHKKVSLDRQAISSSQLKLQPDIVLRILPSSRLKPQQLRIFFHVDDAESWKIGGTNLGGSEQNPIEYSIDQCIEDGIFCTKSENVIQIPLLRLAGNNPLLKQGDDLPKPGKITFSVRFLYSATGTVDEPNAMPLYPYHTVDSSWKTIEVNMVAPVVIPRSEHVVEFPEIVLNNLKLAKLYDETEDKDLGGLNQERAEQRMHLKRERILARHKEDALLKEVATIIVTALAVAAALLFLFLRYYHRRFEPELTWSAANKIALDFNQQPGAKVHVGVLSVNNKAKVPWLGKLLRNDKHPDVWVDFLLLEPSFDKLNFDLNGNEGRSFNPFGFMAVEKSERLGTRKKLVVSHQSSIELFLATDVISDYRADPPNEGETSSVLVACSIEMSWSGGKKSLETPFQLELIPERSKYPKVTFTPSSEAFVFEPNTAPKVGVYCFHSQATHRFSRPFTGTYEIYGLNEANHPLHDNTIHLNGSDQVIVPYSGDAQKRSVVIECDGVHIENPEPGGAGYQFELKGVTADGSECGLYALTLQRNPTPADVSFEVSLGNKNAYRIHWKKIEGVFQPFCRVGKFGRFEPEGSPLEAGTLTLPSRLVQFRGLPMPERLFKLIIGNTGKVGSGRVEAQLTLEWKFENFAERCLEFKEGRSLEELLCISSSEGEDTSDRNKVTILEGDHPKKLEVKLNAGHIIAKIEGGRAGVDSQDKPRALKGTQSGARHDLVDGRIVLVARLVITLHDGQTQTPHRYPLQIVYPLGMEKRPHRNWLCIDFGTSAIVAAVGRGRDAELLPLQRIKEETNQWLNFADMDLDNMEYGTDFLPSFVACDADLRESSDALNDQIRKGSPVYHKPDVLEPGNPDFVSLPATTRLINESPGRVIYSLKSWLAQPTNEIGMIDPPLRYFNASTGRTGTRDSLPLDKVVESGFAALANAYLQCCDTFEQGGQLVLSYPNTFTIFHQKKLRDIAYKALSPYQVADDDERLGLDLRERIQLISESDAVGFYHILQRRNARAIKKQHERLLVYDFGAGTLDLSLVHIEWDEEYTYPAVWTVENRIGVPIAGNHLDTVLARLIDFQLKDKSILNPLQGTNGDSSSLFEYRYPRGGQGQIGRAE